MSKHDFASAAFVACSHDMDFEGVYKVNLKNEYNYNFEKKFGRVDPNQSWDFTSSSNSSNVITRAEDAEDYSVTWTGGSGKTTWDCLSLINGFWNSFIDVDAEKVKSSVAGAPVLNWEHAVAVELFPSYAHGFGIDKDKYFHLAIVEKGKEYTTKNITTIDCIGNISTKDNEWYGAGGALIHNTGRKINAKDIYSENKIWVAYFTWKDNSSNDPKTENAYNMKNISSFEIKTYKEIKVNDHIYWCFDCNKDGKYEDLICLVRKIDQAKPIVKRYLIEDLGSSSDFDFNDIVVDVIQNPDGTQKAQIRAMGGTLNFSLKIGDATWVKKGSKITVDLNGTTEEAEVTKMYNTKNPTYELILSEFEVSGWVPASNNIKVLVEQNDKNASQSGDVIVEIPFPRVGEVPMIIAVDPLVYWNKEWVELREDWWEYPSVTIPEVQND